MKQSIFNTALVALVPLSVALTPAVLARMQQGFSREADSIQLTAAEPKGRIVNVREFGARGDGVADDSAAIQRAIDAAGKNTMIKFPAGVYLVANLRIKDRSGLVFTGEGRRSVIRQKSGAERMAMFEGSSDIVITQLGFDANGIKAYGGVAFYAAKRVRIEKNWFWDGAPKPVESTDRYAVVFGKGPAPSQDVQIVNNVIDDLQLEVNHARRVVIEGNVIQRAVKTAGIGIFTVGNNAVAEDYQIINNKVVDSLGAGISVGIDPPTDRQCRFARITIANNQVIRMKTAGYGIRIGTPDNSKRTDGNIFEDLEIRNNRFRNEATAPVPAQTIFANNSATAAILFTKISITGNTLENAGRNGKEFAVDLRRLQNSLVAENIIKGFTNGVALGGALLDNELRNNVVQATGVAFAVEDSLGGNRAVNNRILGSPRQGWKISALQPNDTVEK
ncbi:MAG: glycosyl hydrolase family 28-related protein [Chloroflexota bacterium]